MPIISIALLFCEDYRNVFFKYEKILKTKSTRGKDRVRLKKYVFDDFNIQHFYFDSKHYSRQNPGESTDTADVFSSTYGECVAAPLQFVIEIRNAKPVGHWESTCLQKARDTRGRLVLPSTKTFANWYAADVSVAVLLMFQ